MAGKDIESSGDDSDDSGDGKGALFVNPLAAKKSVPDKEESEEWSDDDSDSKDGKGKGKKDKKKEKSTILGKRKRKGSFDAVQDFMNDEIEVVPINDPSKKKDGYDSMDSDDIAATRILARKMLRKKARNEIIDSTYNRYTTYEDPSTLPSWFVEDEAKHRFCERIQPTKEEMAAEKLAIKEYNARPSKKVE